MTYDENAKICSRSTLLGSIGLLSFALGGAASPQEPGSAAAVARNVDDSTLAWGACPNFMPSGCALAVLRGDPAEPNADVFFKVPAGSTLPVHWHTSAERMVLIAGELHVAFEGQDRAVLTPGTYAYGPARRPHGANCVSTTPCILFIAFEAPVDATAGSGE